MSIVALSAQIDVNMASSSKRAVASGWPVDGSSLDLVDKYLSSFAANLELGPLELLLSLPGNAFGMAFMTVWGPAALAWVCSPPPPTNMTYTVALSNKIITLSISDVILCFLTFVFHSGWFALVWLERQSFAFAFVWSLPLFAMGPCLGVALARVMTETSIWVDKSMHLDAQSSQSWRVGAFYLEAWSCSMIVVLYLKHSAKRRRPVLLSGKEKYETYYKAVIRRQFPIIAQYLAKDANSSFPSGDVAGAVSFAIPLAYGNSYYHQGGKDPSGMTAIAVVVVLLAAFGRMYYRAHHLLDVTVGGIVAWIVGKFILYDCVHGGDFGNVQWWHPLVCHITVMILMKKTFANLVEGKEKK